MTRVDLPPMDDAKDPQSSDGPRLGDLDSHDGSGLQPYSGHRTKRHVSAASSDPDRPDAMPTAATAACDLDCAPGLQIVAGQARDPDDLVGLVCPVQGRCRM